MFCYRVPNGMIIDDNFIHFLLVVGTLSITGVFILLSKIKFRSLLNPVAIYCFIWGIALVFHITRGSKDFYPLSFSALTMFIVAMGMYAIGGLLAPKIRLSKVLNQMTDQIQLKSSTLWTFYLIVAWVCLIGSMYFLYTVINYFGLSTYLTQGYLVHNILFTEEKAASFPGGIWNYRFIQYVLQPIIYLSAAMAGMFIISERKRRKIFYLPLLSTLLFDLAFVGRFRVYTVGLIYFFAVLFRKKYNYRRYIQTHLKSRKGIFFLVIILIFLTLLSYTGITIIRTYYKDLNFDIYGLSIPEPIFYILTFQVGGLVYFSECYKDLSSFSYGYELFYPIFGKLLNFLNITDIQYEYILNQDYQIGPSLTHRATATYLFVAYKDFGWLGIFVYPFILGWVGGYIYSKHLKSPNILWKAMLLLYYALILVSSTVVWGLSDFGRAIAFIMMLAVTLLFGYKQTFVEIKNNS